jgi:hypothetical protein
MIPLWELVLFLAVALHRQESDKRRIHITKASRVPDFNNGTVQVYATGGLYSKLLK